MGSWHGMSCSNTLEHNTVVSSVGRKYRLRCDKLPDCNSVGRDELCPKVSLSWDGRSIVADVTYGHGLSEIQPISSPHTQALFGLESTRQQQVLCALPARGARCRSPVSLDEQTRVTEQTNEITRSYPHWICRVLQCEKLQEVARADG